MAEIRKFLSLRLVLAGGVLSIGLIAATVMHILAVAEGTEIIIPARPFDPRALLTGHYAQLNYAISRAEVEPTELGPGRDRRRVWVAIVPDGDDWKVFSVSVAKPPAPPPGGHLISAEARSLTSPVQLRYGIERIYAQQAEAEAIQTAVRAVGENEDARLKVVASLGGDGRLRVKGLIAGGQRTDFSWW